jgi:hypothetical protein
MKWKDYRLQDYGIFEGDENNMVAQISRAIFTCN